MALSIGQVLKGRQASYRIINPLKLETVYQANVILLPSSAANGSYSLDLCVEVPRLFLEAAHFILASSILIFLQRSDQARASRKAQK